MGRPGFRSWIQEHRSGSKTEWTEFSSDIPLWRREFDLCVPSALDWIWHTCNGIPCWCVLGHLPCLLLPVDMSFYFLWLQCGTQDLGVPLTCMLILGTSYKRWVLSVLGRFKESPKSIIPHSSKKAYHLQKKPKPKKTNRKNKQTKPTTKHPSKPSPPKKTPNPNNSVNPTLLCFLTNRLPIAHFLVLPFYHYFCQKVSFRSEHFYHCIWGLLIGNSTEGKNRKLWNSRLRFSE